MDGRIKTEKESEVSRRGFLKKITAAIYGTVTFLAGLPLISFFVSPAFLKSEEEWIDLGSAADFKNPEPVGVNYGKLIKDGWNERTSSATAWVYESENELIALSPICTHLGCLVSFDAERDSFACPCHGGLYDRSGAVIGGPPPKPLKRHKIKIVDGNLLIGDPEDQAVSDA